MFGWSSGASNRSRTSLASVELVPAATRRWYELYVDADPGDARPVETRRDVPISYSPERREYGWREVAQAEPVVATNPARTVAPVGAGTDWLAATKAAAEEA